MSLNTPEDPFFIGWEGNPAAVPVNYSKSRTLIFLFAALAIAGIAAALQTDFYASKGTWDFAEKTFDGIFLAEPYPTLISGDQVYYLVLETKHGFPAVDAQGFHLKHVKITGSVIEDPEQPTNMIAVTGASSVQITGDAVTDPRSTASEGKRVTMSGEIADSKCALGAMNPGVFKPHRACAIACLSGGIPAVFIVRHGDDQPASHYLLLDKDGKAMNDVAIDHAALPVTITGQVVALGAWKLLKASPSDIQRIN